MAKFLIEDIIPPEKKHHRSGAKKAHAGGRSVPLTREDWPATRVPRKTISEAFPENTQTPIANEPSHDADVVPTQAEPLHSEESGEGAEGTAPGLDAWARNLEPIEEAQAASISRARISPQFPEYSGVGVDYDGGKGALRAWLPWALGVILFGVAVYFSLNFFGGATITILPKLEQLQIDQKMTAMKTQAEDKLAYAVMIETASSSAEVAATGEKTVIAKASGKIVAYNEQTNTQRLIKNTRFQAPSGKIYRIRDSITIPKGVVVNGAIRPGTLEVTVYADDAGPEYNSVPVDFTIPGLKNSTIYQKVYARSKGPLAGGASGTVKTVSDQDLKQAGENLRIQLETKLRAKARGNLAASQIAYDQGIVVLLGEPALSNAQASSNNKAIVSAEGTIYVVTFQRADLTQALVKVLSPESEGESITIANLDALEFSMEQKKGNLLLDASMLDFTIKGVPELSWAIDDASVKTSLLGLPKERFTEVLSRNASVLRAKADIRPMWKRSFPEDPEKISVILVDEMPTEE